MYIFLDFFSIYLFGSQTVNLIRQYDTDSDK